MSFCIISELRLTGTSLVTRRNIQDLTVSTDVSSVTKIANDEILLTANNSGLNLSTASLTLSSITAFLHLASTGPVNVTFNDGTHTVTTPMSRYLAMTGSWVSVVITNNDQVNSVSVKAIYA